MNRNLKTSMQDALPSYYDRSRIVANLLEREAAELESLNASIAEVLDQFFIDTATWGLSHWERICDIKTDETKPYAQRRSVLKSKLRGIGTVTVDLIQDVAEAYLGGEVQVEELPSLYTIKVTFVGKLGIPPNLDDIKNVLRDIIPAHLAIQFEFTYMSWSDLTSYALTWADVDELALTWEAFEKYKP